MYTQLVKMAMENRAVIANIHVFERTNAGLHGIEIRLRDDNQRVMINGEFDCIHFDPFKYGIPHYQYLVLAYPSTFKKWVNDTFEGHLSTMICRKFNWFESLPRPSDNEVAEYRLGAAQSLQEKYPEAYDIITKESK